MVQCYGQLKTCLLSSSFLLLLAPHLTNCCILVDKVHHCQYTGTISAPGSDAWTTVHLYSNDASVRHILNADRLQSIQNVQELAVELKSVSLEPGAIKFLSKLKRLYVINGSVELSADALQNSGLTQLQIHRLRHSSIPRNLLSQLPNLEDFDFRFNVLKKLEAGIFNNSWVVKINLSENQLEDIEDGALTNMYKLNHVSAYKNKLRSFNSTAVFGENLTLRSLRLDQNQIKVITRDAFTALPNLQKLNLASNLIETVADGAFQNLKSLYYLDLSHNRLQNLQPDVFPLAGLKEMKNLFLHMNQLIFVNLGTLRRLPYISTTSFSGNPLQCGCLNDLLEWMSYKNVKEICQHVHYINVKRTCVNKDVAWEICYYDLGLAASIQHEYDEILARSSVPRSNCLAENELTL